MANNKQYDPLDVYDDQSRLRGLYIVSAAYDASHHRVHVQLKNGVSISFPKERAQVIASATDEQLSTIEVTPAGWGIQFPTLDEGISLAMLVTFRLGSTRWEKEWAEKNLEPVAA